MGWGVVTEPEGGQGPLGSAVEGVIRLRGKSRPEEGTPGSHPLASLSLAVTLGE